MPLLIDTDLRIYHLVGAVNDILTEHGPAGLTMQRISEASGVQKSSIYHHLGSREHLLRVAADQTNRTRLAAFEAESTVDGVFALLPRTDEELFDTRAWLGWLELWRSEDYLERWIAEGRAGERAFLERWGQDRTPQDLDLTSALIDGLRLQVCAPCRPLSREQARAQLATHLRITPRPMPVSSLYPRWHYWGTVI